MSGAERKHVTLADLYRDRGLSETQVRRIVSLLRLTDARRGGDQRPGSGLSEDSPRPTQISTALRAQILDSNCAYCGEAGPTEVEHVVPQSRGGSNEPGNLVAACRLCNSGKRNLTPEEWRAWRESQGLKWPPEGLMSAVGRFLREERRG